MTLSMASFFPSALRQRWRDSQTRIARLERSQKETDMLLDIVLSDAVHSKACELGMHAQPTRRAIVSYLFERLDIKLAVETGTYLGNTSNYLARTFKVPVHSSELVPRYHHAARRMLRELPNIHLQLQDSRDFLKGLAARPELTGTVAFFYLDAHWYNDLPLADEIDIIATNWKQFVILIDDFKVPGDPGYAYDDYGPGKALDTDYLDPVLARHGLKAYFPTTPAAEESGGRAGYVVVVQADAVAIANATSLLRPHAHD